MRLGILYSVCGSVAIISVVGMVLLLIVGTSGEPLPIVGTVFRIIVGSVIGIGALSSGVAKIRIAKMKEANNAKK